MQKTLTWLHETGVYKSPQNLFNAKLSHQDITRKAMQVLTMTSGKHLTVSVLGSRDKQFEATSLYQTRSVRDYAFKMDSAAYAKQLKTRLLNSLYT